MPTNAIRFAMLWWGVAMFCGVLTGCAMSHDVDALDAVITPDGFSDVITFEVPEGARSITIVTEGDPNAVYAVGSLVLADGVERAGLTDLTALTERPGTMLVFGPQRQVGTFGNAVFQYPQVATQPVVSGPASLRIASSIPGSAPTVRIFMPIGEARDLHVSLVSMHATRVEAVEPAFVEGIRSIFLAAGIQLIIDERVDLPIEPAFEPTYPLRPGDHAASLVRAAHAALSTDALPILLVDLEGTQGFSTNVPCAPIPLSSHGVFVDPTPDFPLDPLGAVPRLGAHEIGHALGLTHVEDFPPDGGRVLDPFADTTDFDTTLMGSMDVGMPVTERILNLTPQQVFAMTRSALLR